MRTLLYVAALLLGVAGPALAQEDQLPEPRDWSGLSRAETIDRVSEALAEINEPFAASRGSEMMALGFWDMEQTINDAIDQMVALRDALSGNPYVRVSSFTVGFPWGVSVEISFPEPE